MNGKILRLLQTRNSQNKRCSIAFKAMAALVGLWVTACAPLNAKTFWPGVCSAFNVSGDSATATITPGSITIAIAFADGRNKQITAAVPEVGLSQIQEGEISCDAFFNADGRYLAVVLNNVKSHGRAESYFGNSLHFIITDLTDSKLVGDFLVNPVGVLRGPLLPLGFLQGQPRFMVRGAGAKRPASSFSHLNLHEPNGGEFGTTVSALPSSFSYLVVSTSGKMIQGPTLRTLPVGWSGYENNPDLKHGLLWITDDLLGAATGTVPLLSRGPISQLADRPELRGMGPSAGMTAYLSDHSWITVVDGNDPHVVRFDVADCEFDRIDLPHAWGNLTGVDEAFISPDGEVFAPLRMLQAEALFGGVVDRGYRLDFVDTRTLKLLGSIRLKGNADEQSISIDHRMGAITILSFQKNRWKYNRIKVQ